MRCEISVDSLHLSRLYPWLKCGIPAKHARTDNKLAWFPFLKPMQHSSRVTWKMWTHISMATKNKPSIALRPLFSHPKKTGGLKVNLCSSQYLQQSPEHIVYSSYNSQKQAIRTNINQPKSGWKSKQAFLLRGETPKRVWRCLEMGSNHPLCEASPQRCVSQLVCNGWAVFYNHL